MYLDFDFNDVDQGDYINRSTTHPSHASRTAMSARKPMNQASRRRSFISGLY